MYVDNASGTAVITSDWVSAWKPWNGTMWFSWPGVRVSRVRIRASVFRTGPASPRRDVLTATTRLALMGELGGVLRRVLLLVVVAGLVVGVDRAL